jgi:hypothetical protein
MDLHIFKIHKFNKKVISRKLSLDICRCAHTGVCVHRHASLAPEQLRGFYSYSVFTDLSIMGWCPVNVYISAPEMRSDILTPNLAALKRMYSLKDKCLST